MPRLQQPSEQHVETLAYIVRHIEEHGYQPSLRDMAVHFGLAKTGMLARLRMMAKLGLVRFDRHGTSRALGLPGFRFTAEVPDTAALSRLREIRRAG